MRSLRFLTALGAAAVLALVARPAHAQGPTPEGTVITNTVTASYTDANGNTYSNVTASATVTVGFAPAIDVASAATVTPASPSTGNSLSVTITNGGNGTDSVTVSTTAATGLTITGYTFNSTTYSTLSALNTALSGTAIAAGSSVTIAVVYDVAAGQGGATLPLAITAASRRSTTTSDTSTTNVVPAVTQGVTVTPKGSTIDRLPSNGTQYSATFTVTNGGNADETFDLTASASTATVAIVSVNGVAGTADTVTLTTAAPSTTVTVVYTVANVTAGSAAAITLTATAQSDNTVTDAGDLTVTVIKAALAMTKQPYRDDQTTAITSTDRVTPGEFIRYKLTVTNNGGAAATAVQITDTLPIAVTYDSAAGDAAGWTIAESSGTVTASLSGSLAAGASRFIWIRVKVK